MSALASPASTALRWTTQSLAPQLVLRREARAGQLGARLAVDRGLWDNPYPVYEQMRAQGDLITGRLVDSSVSHRVIGEVLRSPAFGVDMMAAQRISPLLRRVIAAGTDPWAVGPIEPPSMLAVDPPDHTRYRRLVSKVFTARAVAALEQQVETIASELLDEMAVHDRVELVERYATPLPVRVIATILGVPREMQPHMTEWGNAAAITLDPAMTYRQFKDATAALRNIHRWLADHLDRLRREPGDDLLSRLAVLVDDGEALDDVELRATALLVIGAGFETTVNLISNGVDLLLAHPEQLALLRDDPSMWPNAVEEILRFEPPVQATARVALVDTELAGHQLPAGRPVVGMLAGANRDPEVFDSPGVFDVTRPNARDHLAFSAGIHFCLGASLARLEGAVALRRLFERFPDLGAVGRPRHREMRILRGWETYPVELRRRSPASADRGPAHERVMSAR